MKTLYLLIFAAAIAGVLSSCELYEQDRYEEQIVVESYLVANDPLPAVNVSTTAPFGVRYVFEDQAVGGAAVRVRLLKDDGTVDAVYFYREARKGVYEPEDESARVQPQRRYDLTVEVPGSAGPVTARTFVPGDFEAVRVTADSVAYQSNTQFEVDVTRSFYPGRQSIYIASVRALDPEMLGLTPFYADLDEDPEDWIVNMSGLVNEGNFTVNPDNSLRLKLPWISIAYYGPNEITLFAVDDNFYDFWRSADIQQGGSTLSPGEIPNVINHVDGGTGLFAGLSRSSLDIFVKPRGMP